MRDIMDPYRRSTAVLVIFVALAATGCAGKSARHQGTQVAVTVHAVIAGIDDAERAINNPTAHAKLNAPILNALKAGRAFDDAVRALPPDGKFDGAALRDLTTALGDVARAVEEALPGDQRTGLDKAIIAAQQAVLLASALLMGGA
jgi:hypothetical protein